MTKNRVKSDCDFSKWTKEHALERSDHKCEKCGSAENLQVHHILGIWLALNNCPEITKEMIKSLANAEVVCAKCHEHEDQLSQQNYAIYAQALLGLWYAPYKVRMSITCQQVAEKFDGQ